MVLAADWLQHHAAPDERIVAMGRPHYLFLTDFAPDRIVPFYDLDARDAAGLAEEMRRRGLTWLVATWRKPVAQAIDRVYETKFKWFLVDPFRDGRPVAGFEHVSPRPSAPPPPAPRCRSTASRPPTLARADAGKIAGCLAGCGFPSGPGVLRSPSLAAPRFRAARRSLAERAVKAYEPGPMSSSPAGERPGGARQGRRG